MTKGRDGHTWVVGPSIADDERLDRLRRVLDESAVIVEHRFYFGATAPHRFVVDDFDYLRAYLSDKTRPGDSLWFWRFDEICRDENPITHGKVPDERGLVPEGGAY
jgi:hypothetical protein